MFDIQRFQVQPWLMLITLSREERKDSWSADRYGRVIAYAPAGQSSYIHENWLEYYRQQEVRLRGWRLTVSRLFARQQLH